MFSKILFLCSACTLIATLISAEPLEVVTPSFQKTIKIENYGGFQYVSTEELLKLAEGSRSTSYLKRKETLKLWNKVFVFSFLSQYMVCDGQTYNLILATKYENNNLYVPLKSFFKIAAGIINKEINLVNGTLYLDTQKGSGVQKKEAKEKFVVVLDPGHGGKDPGAIGPGNTYEKDIVLSVALELEDILEKTEKWEVILTRDEDVFVPLDERARIANEAKADIFVSLHCNGSKKSSARGSECYYLSPAKNDEGRATAALENSALLLEEKPIVTSVDEVEFMLADMLQNEFLRESSRFAVIIQEELESKSTIPSRKVNYAPFYVLYNVFAPSVLVEMAFITNKEDEKLLKKGEVQKKLALAIKNGLDKFHSQFLEME